MDSIYGHIRTAQDKKLQRQAMIAAGIPLILSELKAE